MHICKESRHSPWAQFAITQPSTLTVTANIRNGGMRSSRVNIHALGVSHNDPVNCKLVSEVIQMAQPDLIALEASDIMKLLF